MPNKGVFLSFGLPPEMGTERKMSRTKIWVVLWGAVGDSGGGALDVDVSRSFAVGSLSAAA